MSKIITLNSRGGETTKPITRYTWCHSVMLHFMWVFILCIILVTVPLEAISVSFHMPISIHCYGDTQEHPLILTTGHLFLLFLPTTRVEGHWFWWVCTQGEKSLTHVKRCVMEFNYINENLDTSFHILVDYCYTDTHFFFSILPSLLYEDYSILLLRFCFEHYICMLINI